MEIKTARIGAGQGGCGGKTPGKQKQKYAGKASAEKEYAGICAAMQGLAGADCHLPL